ncbi:MAG: mannose-1-phosphate guanylyltransferase [Thermoguttaceae bacterium]|nr:mannose-1-phosphate guanylyltransferase [Thermoguttaceae bacterium]
MTPLSAARSDAFSSAVSDATFDFSAVCAVVMAGGSGTRLWPESRRNRPKPFLPLLPDGRSTLAATFARLDGLVPPERRFVVAGRSFASLVAEALPTLETSRTLLEPCGRDVAPCVAWAALEALQVDENATLIVLPSDHLVAPDEAFRATLAQAVRLVEEDETRLVTLGVVPTEPSSAYGYVEVDAPLASLANNDVAGVCDAYSVASFREKPDLETARRFLATGRYFWNAGIFVWKARRILELIRRFEPELGATFDRVAPLVADAAANGRSTADDPTFVREFSNAKRISIDYAVLERASNVVVLRAPFAWDDLGSFAALERTFDASQTENSQLFKDDSGNVATGAELVVENARRSFVRVLSTPNAADGAAKSPTKRRKIVALVDVDDLLVVETDDALLVAKKGNDAALRRLVERLKNDGLDAYL